MTVRFLPFFVVVVTDYSVVLGRKQNGFLIMVVELLLIFVLGGWLEKYLLRWN